VVDIHSLDLGQKILDENGRKRGTEGMSRGMVVEGLFICRMQDDN